MSSAISLQPGSEPVPGYRLIARLGKGGFGEVWKAEGPGGFLAAVKLIELESRAGEVETRALELARAVRHINLLNTYGAWTRERFLVLAMELADRTLADRLDEAVAEGLPGIPRDELWSYMDQAAAGLDYLNSHRHSVAGKANVGIQHRDIKPQNILLVGDGVKIGDFGLARLLEKTKTGHTGAMSIAYAAPEFFNEQTSDASDQYSLAVTYCELRSGRFPFEGSMQQVMMAHVMHPPDLSMLPAEERPAIERALAKKPKERWPSCRAMVQGLKAAVPSAGKMVLLPDAETQLPAEVSKSTPSRPIARRDAVRVDKTPALLIAPFSAEQARTTQAAWAQVLGKKVEEEIDLGGGLKMVFVLIPPGKFLMGSPREELSLTGDNEAYDEEVPQHEVTITQPFYLGKYEVTQGEHMKVTGKANPSYFAATGQGKLKVTGQDTMRFPVEQVDHEEVVAFCAALGNHTGSGWEKIRLPSEAMWEYACRAGTQTRWHVGDALAASDANFNFNLGRTRAVGGGRANGFGLYDMHGNVYEWCSDYYEKYADGTQSDPEGPKTGSIRVYRGGSGDGSVWSCRSAFRGWYLPSDRDFNLGFRAALVPVWGGS